MSRFSKRRFYTASIWGLVFLPILLYLIYPPELPVAGKAWQYSEWSRVMLMLSQWTGLGGFSAFALSFVFSSRYPPLENLFGGLDRIYRLHHQLGIVGFSLILAHPLFYGLRFLLGRPLRSIEVFAPFHKEWAVNIGVFTFWLFVLLILITLIRRIAYNWWKQSHRFMGVVLAGAAWHMLTVAETPGKSVAHVNNPLLNSYLIVLLVLGGGAYLYKELWISLIKEEARYRVRKIHRIGRQMMRIDLQPLNNPLEYRAGQFAFVRFEQDDLSSEQHPFTLCLPPSATSTTITVKVLGDFTRRLFEKLKEGSMVSLEGPYGRFSYQDRRQRQIWLAGGVGSTPFVCWLHELYLQGDTTYKIDLYYCAHERKDMVFQKELEEWGQSLDGVRVKFVCTGEEGRLTADRIEWHQEETPDFFLCGPRGFVQQLEKQLMEKGVSADRLHQEEFEFR